MILKGGSRTAVEVGSRSDRDCGLPARRGFGKLNSVSITIMVIIFIMTIITSPITITITATSFIIHNDIIITEPQPQEC